MVAVMDYDPNYHRRYREQHRERIAARKREEYLADAERIKARSREWSANNREKKLSVQAEYRKNNKDKRNRYMKDRYQKTALN